MLSRKKLTDHPAVLWLDHEHLYLGLPSANQGLDVHRVHWNPERLEIQSAAASQKLTTALLGLSKQFSLQRMNMRLCLDDGLCVTRVVTGDHQEVERELEAIRHRSQLYLSLGLGEKLTGNLSIQCDSQTEYALTSIVNQRTIQVIYSAITAARLQLTSIEPVTLSVTRAMGLLGVDRHQPILFVSADHNRCDLAITRAGQLMLSYRISGVRQPNDIASQIDSNLTRLRRFCTRVRGQGEATLQKIFIFGESSRVEALRAAMRPILARIEIANVELPETVHRVGTEPIPNVVCLALWAAGEWRADRNDCLPAPDLLEQLVKLQRKSLPQQLIAHFIPTAVAACLMLIVFGLYLNDRRSLAVKTRELLAFSDQVVTAESEIAQWESKQRQVDAYEKLQSQLAEESWHTLVRALAPCIPDNARLESLAYNDDRSVTLHGVMVARDQTYEMLAAIKQLPHVVDVSLESVSSLGDQSQKQFQFEVKFRTLGDSISQPASSASSTSGPPLAKTLIGLPMKANKS